MIQATSTNDSVLETLSHIKPSDLVDATRRGEKWAMLTCHDPISARIFDHAKIPCLLVSDLAAHTVYGYKSRASMTLDEMIPVARAVKSSCKRALVVADLPYGSYEESPQQALKSATLLVREAGVDAVKLEGNHCINFDIAEHVRTITRSDIAVIAHLKLRPRTEHTIGGYKLQGRDDIVFSDFDYTTSQIIDHFRRSGAFACLLDLVSSESVRNIRLQEKIPIIGIGSGPHCDAQLMIWQDMAGFSVPKSDNSSSSSGCSYTPVQHSAGRVVIPYESEETPRFVKKYTNLGEMLYKAAVAFREDVKCGVYPPREN